MSTSSRKLNSGISASEAGRLSGAARRAKKAPDSKIIAALRRKAEQGDVQAARLILDYEAKQQTREHEDVVLSMLSTEELATLRGWIEAK